MGEKRMAEVDDPIFSNEQPVFFPFGPPIYVDRVLEEYIVELDNLIEEHGGKIEFDASGLLAGRIRKQTSLETLISDDLEHHIVKHCMRYNEHARGNLHVGGGLERTPLMQLDAIWSNIQEPREYNPPHMHTGHFSFVIYCRNDLQKYSIEELQDNEYDKPHDDKDTGGGNWGDNRKLAGLIELQYGEPNWMNWNTYQFVPKRGDIIIFPSWLRHTVYAHYQKDCVRVSVAGNVSIVGE